MKIINCFSCKFNRCGEDMASRCLHASNDYIVKYIHGELWKAKNHFKYLKWSPAKKFTNYHLPEHLPDELFEI
jgi:hypothetical protein